MQSLWNTVWQFLKKLKHRVTLWLCNSIPGHLLNRNENLCLHKHLPILLYLIKSCNGFPFSVWYGLSFSSHEIKPSTVQLLPLQASFLLSFVSHFALITEHPAVLCKHLRAFAYVVSLTWNDLNFPFEPSLTPGWAGCPSSVKNSSRLLRNNTFRFLTLRSLRADALFICLCVPSAWYIH